MTIWSYGHTIIILAKELQATHPATITAIIGWGINKVVKGITVTALIARRIKKEKK